VALFSDVDWVIIAIVAAFLFLGPQGRPFVRQLGRWYGRMLQLKAELMSEVSSVAGVPDGAPRPTSSFRAALFGIDEPVETAPGPLPLPSHPGMITQVQPVTFWAVETQTLGAGLGAGAWWATTSDTPGEVVRLR
jgi:hypothetical protein